MDVLVVVNATDTADATDAGRTSAVEAKAEAEVEEPTTPVGSQLVPVLLAESGEVESSVDDLVRELCSAEAVTAVMPKILQRMEASDAACTEFAKSIVGTSGLLYLLRTVLDNEGAGCHGDVIQVLSKCAAALNAPATHLATPGTTEGTSSDFIPSLVRLSSEPALTKRAIACMFHIAKNSPHTRLVCLQGTDVFMQTMTIVKEDVCNTDSAWFLGNLTYWHKTFSSCSDCLTRLSIATCVALRGINECVAQLQFDSPADDRPNFVATSLALEYYQKFVENAFNTTNNREAESEVLMEKVDVVDSLSNWLALGSHGMLCRELFSARKKAAFEAFVNRVVDLAGVLCSGNTSATRKLIKVPDVIPAVVRIACNMQHTSDTRKAAAFCLSNVAAETQEIIEQTHSLFYAQVLTFVQRRVLSNDPVTQDMLYTLNNPVNTSASLGATFKEYVMRKDGDAPCRVVLGLLGTLARRYTKPCASGTRVRLETREEIRVCYYLLRILNAIVTQATDEWKRGFKAWMQPEDVLWKFAVLASNPMVQQVANTTARSLNIDVLAPDPDNGGRCVPQPDYF